MNRDIKSMFCAGIMILTSLYSANSESNTNLLRSVKTNSYTPQSIYQEGSGRDPFFPKAKKEEPIKVIEPVYNIKITGISGLPQNRFATIGGYTFGKGDKAFAKINDSTNTVYIECLEVGPNSAKVKTPNGKTLELKL